MDYPVKNYASTYIYMKGDYERPLINTIMTCDRIDKHSERFESIIVDIKKRQETTVLVDVLMSDNVVLMTNKRPCPDAFSVFTAKDIKSTNKEMKVFIDCTSIIVEKNGFYVCNRADVLIAYLISAMTQLVYYTDAKRILTNTSLCIACTDSFVSMFYYIIDYLRLSGAAQNKMKLYYLIAMYFQSSVLLKPIDDLSKNTASKIAGINSRESNLVDILYDEEKDFKDIKTFIDKLCDIFNFKGFTVDVFIERWRYLFGRGTQFGPELYPSFSSILTNAYCGCYLNQQKTIEKVVGRNIVTYTSALLNVGYNAFANPYK